MEVKIVEVIGFRSEDAKYSTINLLQGGKWISEKKSRSSVNDVTLRLNKMAVINALDIEHFSPGVRDQKWDLMRITCVQPFLHNEQFGLSFCKVFSFPKKEPPPRPQTPPQPGSAFTKMRELITAKVSPVVLNRSEKLLLAAKEKESPHRIKASTIKEATFTSWSPKQGTKFLASSKGNESQFSLGVPSSPKSFRYTPVKQELMNSCRSAKSSRSPSTCHIIDTTPHRKKTSVCKPLETHKKSSSSSVKSNCKGGSWLSDLDIITLDSDSDASTVVMPLLSPNKCKHSSLSDESPARLKRDFDSDSETVILGDMTPKKIGKFTSPVKIESVSLEKNCVGTKSDFNKPSESLVLEYSELPGPSKIPCPLCSEPFDLSSIEKHAATCDSNSELTMACPVCSKYFPPEILGQHADICVEING